MKSEKEKELEAELQRLREEQRVLAEQLLRELETMAPSRVRLENELAAVKLAIGAKAREARQAGASGPKIAAALGVAHQTVYEMLEKEGVSS